jgi:predicted nucleic acid-binding protein
MSRVWEAAARKNPPRRRIFDARLAYTLLHNDVSELATHNVKDFRDFGFERVFDPVVGGD